MMTATNAALFSNIVPVAGVVGFFVIAMALLAIGLLIHRKRKQASSTDLRNRSPAPQAQPVTATMAYSEAARANDRGDDWPWAKHRARPITGEPVIPSLPTIPMPAINSEPITPVLSDPTFEAIKRQAQAGLFATPRPRDDENKDKSLPS